jgi:hypothetical protein
LNLEENILYGGWPNCLRLSNGQIECFIATDIGLRLLHLGFIGGRNFFYLSPGQMGKTGGDQWRIYGGHRLWIAPESIPGSYHPDNFPISWQYDQKTLKIMQPVESSTGIIKEMEITLSPDKPVVSVLHRLINKNQSPVKLSAWALSAMAAAGTTIIPQEPYGTGDEYLLPVRSMSLWSYTTMDDPRWIWGKKYIQARQDPVFSSEQKIGLLNRQGWMAYCMNNEFMLKIFPFDPLATYPDFNSNNEVYINGDFLELETLGPFVEIPTSGKTELLEHWLLGKGSADKSEESIDRVILPVLNDLRNHIAAG